MKKLTLTPHQRRITDDMKSRLHDSIFASEGESIGSLVDALEGLFSAGDFKDELFRNQWYKHWSALEQARNVTPAEDSFGLVLEEMTAMLDWLESCQRLSA